MSFSVEISDQAHADVQIIYDYIAERAPAGARRWYEAYQAALDKLEANANRHPLAPESNYFPDEVRQLLFKTRRGHRYRILYSLFGSRVVVLHVRGPGQEFVRA